MIVIKCLMLVTLIIILVMIFIKNSHIKNKNKNNNNNIYLDRINQFVGKNPKIFNTKKCRFSPRINKFYKPYIINKPMLNKILYSLLCDINQKKNENFVLINYDSGTIISLPNGDKRYIIRAFVHNKRNDVSKKVEIDVLLFKKTNSIKLFSIKMGKSLNNMDKLPKSTTNENLNRSKFNNLSENIDISLDYLLLDEFLETNDNGVKCEQSKNDRGFHNFPCRKIGKWWDTNGVKNIEFPNDKCYGINSSGKERINIVDDLVVTKKNENTYSWLHGLDTGIPSYPNTNFTNSGKFGSN